LIISPYFTVLEAMASQIISSLNFVLLNRPTLDSRISSTMVEAVLSYTSKALPVVTGLQLEGLVDYIKEHLWTIGDPG